MAQVEKSVSQAADSFEPSLAERLMFRSAAWCMVCAPAVLFSDAAQSFFSDYPLLPVAILTAILLIAARVFFYLDAAIKNRLMSVCDRIEHDVGFFPTLLLLLGIYSPEPFHHFFFLAMLCLLCVPWYLIVFLLLYAGSARPFRVAICDEERE